MTGIGIRSRGSGDRDVAFELDDGTWLTESKLGFLVMPEDQALRVGLTSLRNAFRESGLDSSRATLWLGVGEENSSSESRCPTFREDVRLDLSDDRAGLLVALGIQKFEYDDDDAPWRVQIPKVLAPLLSRRRCGSASLDIDGWGDDTLVTARFAVPLYGRTVADAVHVGNEAFALLKAAEGGALRLETTVELVRTGYARSLIDQEEGAWFDGKQSPYQLEVETQKFELAKDVASFANTRYGGLVVIGARTAKRTAGDVVIGIADVPLSLVSPERYRKVVSDRVHPAVEGLEVRVVERTPGRGIAFIYVPVQRPELQPFVVRGAVIAGKVNNSFVSIPERDGEDTRYSGTAEIHSLLQAGRVALRSSL